MEEIILSVPGDEALEQPSDDVPRSRDRAPVAELRDRLHRDIFRSRKTRDRFTPTALGRRRRHESFDLAMKSLAKSTATEIARPIADRSSRMEVRTRIYAAMMVLVEAASRDRALVLRRTRRARLNGIILAIATMSALGLLAASRGWIALTV